MKKKCVFLGLAVTGKRMSIVARIIRTAFLLLLPLLTLDSAWAQRGCCSWHGGVSGCDSSVGRLVCNDSTYSPSCRCPIEKTVIEVTEPVTEEVAPLPVAPAVVTEPEPSPSPSPSPIAREAVVAEKKCSPVVSPPKVERPRPPAKIDARLLAYGSEAILIQTKDSGRQYQCETTCIGLVGAKKNSDVIILNRTDSIQFTTTFGTDGLCKLRSCTFIQ